MSRMRQVKLNGETVEVRLPRMTKKTAWGLGVTAFGLASRLISWNVLPHDSWDERFTKSALADVGIHQWWDEEFNPSKVLPSELQGRATLDGGRTYGKIATFVAANTRFENETPLLGWDSAQGGRTATLVTDVLLPQMDLAERVPIEDNTALFITGYNEDGEQTGIPVGGMNFRTLDPEVATELSDGTYGCEHVPGDTEYRGCQTASTADDGLFTQDIWKIIQTSAPGETVKVAKKMLDVVSEGTLRCGIDEQLIPEINSLYEAQGISERIDNTDEFARTLLRALIRDYNARAGVPVQLQVIEMADDHWEPPRTVTEAFGQDIQTFFNKFKLDSTLQDPAFCLDAQGAPAFNLDIAMSPTQIAFGGLAIPLAGWDQINDRFSNDPRFALDMTLFTSRGISN